MQVNASQVTTVDELLSNQEKVNTKVILHSAHAISTTKVSIILRSSSGDTDIIIIKMSFTDTFKRVLEIMEMAKIGKVFGLTKSTWMTT